MDMKTIAVVTPRESGGPRPVQKDLDSHLRGNDRQGVTFHGSRGHLQGAAGSFSRWTWPAWSRLRTKSKDLLCNLTPLMVTRLNAGGRTGA